MRKRFLEFTQSDALAEKSPTGSPRREGEIITISSRNYSRYLISNHTSTVNLVLDFPFSYEDVVRGFKGKQGRMNE